MMKMTLVVCCDVCEYEVDQPFEDEEVTDGTVLGDEHETSGLTYVTNYEGSATVWLCDSCHDDHKEERAEYALAVTW
jgi:hypothetical protein